MAAALIRPRDVGALTLAAGAWGIGTVVSKRAVEEFPPTSLLSLQLSASLVALLLFARLTHTSLRGSSALLARLGLLNPGRAYALSLIGLATISASLSVMLWAFEPLLILALAAVFL